MPFLNGKSLKSIRLLLLYQAIYARQNWSITFSNSESLKSMRLLLLYQAIYDRQNWSIAFPNNKNLKSMRLLLLYQAIHVCRNWSIIYLPIDRLHLICRNCLTTFLPTYDVNKKYSSYIPMISCHCCCLKLVGAFRNVIYCGVFYCQRVFMGFMHFTTIA